MFCHDQNQNLEITTSLNWKVFLSNTIYYLQRLNDLRIQAINIFGKYQQYKSSSLIKGERLLAILIEYKNVITVSGLISFQ